MRTSSRSSAAVGGVFWYSILSDQGAPTCNAELAAQLATLGVPAFTCTLDRFPDLMAAAIQKQHLRDFAAQLEK